MNIAEIQAAVLGGETVHWSNSGYTVTRDCLGQWHIKHCGGSVIGLTNRKGDKLNGKPHEFYVGD